MDGLKGKKKKKDFDVDVDHGQQTTQLAINQS